MAGTSATIFEWEDSGNGFLRGGHRSLRFPSDTAHSFAQWGQNLFGVVFKVKLVVSLACWHGNVPAASASTLEWQDTLIRQHVRGATTWSFY